MNFIIELLSPIFIYYQSTNRHIIYVIYGILTIILMLPLFITLVRRQYFSKEPTYLTYKTISAVLGFFIYIFSIVMFWYPYNLKNIHIDVKETKYQQVDNNIKVKKHTDGENLISKQMITKYDVTVHYSSAQKDIKAYEIVDKYNKSKDLSQYPEEYHNKTLTQVHIMPITVETNWHGIKEIHKDLYKVERTYTVEPDIKAYESDQKLKNDSQQLYKNLM